MVVNRTHNEISSLLTWEAGEKKWEVFAQFWEAVRSSTSHLFIDNQLVSLKLRKIKNCARSSKPLGGVTEKGQMISPCRWVIGFANCSPPL
jgi:hypothetical protein